MGMSTHIIGIKPPDAKWKKMKAAYDACEAAGVEPPKAVFNFFDLGNYGSPDPAGVRAEIEDSDAVSVYNSESETGYEVDITRLPPDVKIVRFYNAW